MAAQQCQSAGMADLAARLTKRLADANAHRNLVFSPLSVHAVLALLAAGAGGDTLEEILRVLGARSRRELEDSAARLLDGPLRDTSSEPGGGGGPSVAFACGVWSDLTRPLKPAFRDAVAGRYQAEAMSADFGNDPDQARRQIDAWAAAATRNLVQSAVPPSAVHRDTKLVLANAIYFKGKWAQPFHEGSTVNKPFYRLDGTAVEVPFMSNHGRQYIAEHDGFKVLKLGYNCSSRGMCMCIFLPDARDGLGSLMDKITSSSSSPGFLREYLPKSTVRAGEFGVPKFELSFQSSLAGVLNDMGLLLPFTTDADLAEMLEEDDGDGLGSPLFVQDVFQKAVIQVDEEGTRAAAFTALACSPSYSPDLSRPVDFVADHPFAYFVLEEASQAVLFAGHVVDPGNGAAAVIPSPAPFEERTATKREAADEVMYNPYSPAYSPYSPVYSPTPPAYGPCSPVYYWATSPVYHPCSPAYRPTSPVYDPCSPAYSPTSPTYSPCSPAYSLTPPAQSPVCPAYQPGPVVHIPVPYYSSESPAYSPAVLSGTVPNTSSEEVTPEKTE